MTRKMLAFGVFAVVALIAVPSFATSTPAFKLTTTSGKSASFIYNGFTFSSGSSPKIGAAGKVEVDVLINTTASKKLLKKGALKSASLHVVATLPKKINKTYKLVGPKITSVEFEQGGNSGPVGAVKLSYKSVTD